MASIYRSAAGRAHIRRWCTDQLDAWPVPHERSTVAANGTRTHVVTAGSGASTVVFVPGTNFSAAASLPLATALVAAGHRVCPLDVPGRPGLSSGDRSPSHGRLPWYGLWLSEVIETVTTGPAVVMGHSFGAAIALSSASPRIDRLILVSPGGLTRLRLTPGVLSASAAWFLRPTPARAAQTLRRPISHTTEAAPTKASPPTISTVATAKSPTAAMTTAQQTRTMRSPASITCFFFLVILRNASWYFPIATPAAVRHGDDCGSDSGQDGTGAFQKHAQLEEPGGRAHPRR